MQYFVYIGKDSKTINLFSKLSIGVFYAASNCNQAIKVLDKIREKYDTALFFEQINLSQDIANIHYMRKKYPGLYMVLVIDSLSKEEAPEYLKAGINNTIKYETNPESLQALSTFLKHRKDQKIQALQLKTQNLNAFRLPLWKRAFDIVFSGMALLCLSPLLILTALAIRLESKGPIIYKSKRVGSNYLIFDFLKFRSMYTDADKHLKDFNTLNQYQQEEEQEEDIWGEEQETEEIQKVDEEEIHAPKYANIPPKHVREKREQEMRRAYDEMLAVGDGKKKKNKPARRVEEPEDDFYEDDYEDEKMSKAPIIILAIAILIVIAVIAFLLLR